MSTLRSVLPFASRPHLTATQDTIITHARLEDFSEAQLDTWFAARGVQHARLRFLVSSYAKLDWLTSFPRYTSNLHDELSHYDAVLTAAFARHCTPGIDPDPNTRRLAHADARGVFLTLLDGIPLVRCMYRLSMADLETYAPSVPYELPPLDDDIYSHLAPQPDHTPLPPQLLPQVQVDAEPLPSEPPPIARGRGRGYPRARSRGRARGRSRGGAYRRGP